MITGAYVVFAFGITNSLPAPIRQAYGKEILLYCSREALTGLAVAILAGRVIVLLGRFPFFAVTRVLTMQMPLFLLSYAPQNVRHKSRRFLVRYRRRIDLVVVLALKSPNGFSIAIGIIIFVKLQTGSWLLIIGIAFFLALVFFSWDMVEDEKNSVIRFRYRRAYEDLRELKSLSYSTGALCVALIVGQFQANSMIDDAPLINFDGRDVSVFYMGDRHAVFTWENEKQERFWELVPENRVESLRVRTHKVKAD